MPFLPFTRPSIDERTIAEVAEVLRSGWITTGPKCQAFEAALSAALRRPAGARCSTPAPPRWNSRCACAGIGPGDEVITTPMTWVATANVVARGRRHAGVRRRRSGTRNIDLDRVEAAITPRTRALMPVYLAGLPVDLDRLYALAATARPARGRGRGAGLRRALGRARDRQLRRPRSLQLPGQQEHHLRRRRLPGAERRGRSRRVERLRLQGVGALPASTAWTSSAWGGKSNMTDIAAAIGLGQLRQHRRVHRAGAPAGAALLRALATGSALGFELPPADTGSTATGTCSSCCCRATLRRDARRVHAGMKRAAASASACTTPRCICSRCTARMGWREGMFPDAEDIGRTHPDAAAVPGDDRRRRRSRLRRRGRCDCRPDELGSWPRVDRDHAERRTLSVVIPVYNEEAGLAGAVRAALPGARRARPALRDHLRQRRQPRPFGRAAGRAVQRAARRHAGDPVQRQLRPALAILAGFEHCRGRSHRHARRRPAEPARGHPHAAGRDGRRPRLRRHRSGATARTRPGAAGPRGR